jgi:hypothetical protein
MKNFGDHGYFISDRSGFKFPRREAILEPGTKLMIHKSESDGMYNQVDHPQANLTKWARFGGDPEPIRNIRPDQNYVVDMFLLDTNGDFILDSNDQPIYSGEL